MGWSSGTCVAEGLIKAIKKHVKCEIARKNIYKGIIETLEESDWDCQTEAMGIDDAFDEALKELHPKWEL